MEKTKKAVARTTKAKATTKAAGKKAAAKKAAKPRNGTKSATIKIRDSKRIPGSIQQRYGTRRELLQKLALHELGWCTTDNLLYIKLEHSLKAVASDSGGTPVEIQGTADQVEVKAHQEGDVTVYTLSLADVIVDAQVPPVPEIAPEGKVLMANAEGKMEWADLPVYSADEVEL